MTNSVILPRSVDTAFNFGAYNATAFRYRSVVFQCKSKNVAKKLGTSNNGQTYSNSSQQISGYL